MNEGQELRSTRIKMLTLVSPGTTDEIKMCIEFERMTLHLKNCHILN